jgi:WD40 repeat protein
VNTLEERVIRLTGHSGYVTSTAFSPDGELALTASYDQTARLWSVSDGRFLGPAMMHAGRVKRAIFSADGTLVMTKTEDGIAAVWDVASRQRLSEESFSPDPERPLAVGDDDTVRIGTAARHEPVVIKLHAPPAPGYGGYFQPEAEFSRDGKSVLTLSRYEHVVQVWDSATGLSLANFGESNLAARSATLSPDGERVLVATDSMAKIYACTICGSLESLAEAARARVTRTLTPAERRRYLGFRAFLR